mgnify:CR=1 FL=1
MRRIKTRILICIILLLLVGYGIGVYRINTQFSQVKLEEIPFGIGHEVTSGVYMKVNEFFYLDKEELYQAYGYKLSYDGEIKAFLISVTYSNESESTKSVAVYNNNIEKVGYSNGIDPMLYDIVNEYGLEFELEKGEKKDVTLTYILSDFQFANKKWKKVQGEEFVVTTSRYPIKRNWLLE